MDMYEIEGWDRLPPPGGDPGNDFSAIFLLCILVCSLGGYLAHFL